MPNQKTSTKPELRAINGKAAKSEERIDRPTFQILETETVIEGRAFEPGVHYFGFDKNGRPIDVRVCNPLYVTSEVIDRDGKHSLLLEFQARDAMGRDVRKEWVMPKSCMGGFGSQMINELRDRGLDFDPGTLAEKYALEYVKQHSEPSKVARVTDQPGWHLGTCFALPSRVIGSRNVIYRKGGNDDEVYAQAGDLNEWKASVAKLCIDNPILILSVCCALAGPLLSKLGVTGGGVHLVGDSSTGKSLAQKVAASVWGDPESFVGSWDATKNGVEIHLYKRNHTLAALDEISRVSAKQLPGIIYMSCNGGGKISMNQEREGRSVLTWRVLILSSGEKTVAEHAALAGDTANAGAELRMIDVDAGNRKHRAFDNTHGRAGADFHSELSSYVRTRHGTAGPAFVEHLANDLEKLDLAKEFAKHQSQFETKNAQAGRVVERFAIMAMAGEMAIEYGVLPWKPGTALQACQQLYGEWVARVGSGNAEDRKILIALSEYLDTYGDAKFADITFNNPANGGAHELSGYYRVEEGNRLYMLYAAALKKAVPNFGPDRVCLALKEAGALITQSDGRNQKVVSIPNKGKARMYNIDYEKVQKALEEN